jgi:glucosamine kinase
MVLIDSISSVNLPPTPAPHATAGCAYRVGVDGGGTGTRARLQDASGRTLGEGRAGPSGLSQGVAQSWRHIGQAITAAFAAAGRPQPAVAAVALGLGLAGAEVEALNRECRNANPGYALGLLVNDGFTQLAGAHAGRPGIVVSCGTGAVAAAMDAEGRVRRSGGWGWPAGDEGSGAWLGLQAARALQHALDGRAAAGMLSAAVARITGADAPALQAWLAAAGQHQYAQLAPLVFDAAEQGDAAAAALLDRAAAEMARLVHALSHGAGAGTLPIVLNGSVGTRLAPRWPAALQARLVPAAGDGADGALLLLRRALGDA